MTNYAEVAPENARLGDLVFNGSVKGVVRGVSNDDAHAAGGTVTVQWSNVPGCDVVGIKSPVWMHYDILGYRPEPEQRTTSIADVVALNDKNSVWSDPPETACEQIVAAGLKLPWSE